MKCKPQALVLKKVCEAPGCPGRDAGSWVPWERYEILRCSMEEYKIRGYPLRAGVLTGIHFELTSFLAVYSTTKSHSITGCCSSVTPCHLQDGSAHPLSVHLAGKNLRDMKHTVEVLGGATHPLVLPSPSLCPFILLQDIHKAYTLMFAPLPL